MAKFGITVNDKNGKEWAFFFTGKKEHLKDWQEAGLDIREVKEELTPKQLQERIKGS